MSETDSAYLKTTSRLGDVISAIQFLGSYSFYKLDFEKIAQRISGSSDLAKYWESLLNEHPEFFRIDSTGKKASLVWRRSFKRNYHVDMQKSVDINSLSNEEKNRISRRPLTSEEIGVLVSTAINLHSRAIEHNKENRWLTGPLFTILGIVLGAFLTYIQK